MNNSQKIIRDKTIEQVFPGDVLVLSYDWLPISAWSNNWWVVVFVINVTKTSTYHQPDGCCDDPIVRVYNAHVLVNNRIIKMAFTSEDKLCCVNCNNSDQDV